jgi:hypothetical protein
MKFGGCRILCAFGEGACFADADQEGRRIRGLNPHRSENRRMRHPQILRRFACEQKARPPAKMALRIDLSGKRVNQALGDVGSIARAQISRLRSHIELVLILTRYSKPAFRSKLNRRIDLYHR